MCNMLYALYLIRHLSGWETAQAARMVQIAMKANNAAKRVSIWKIVDFKYYHSVCPHGESPPSTDIRPVLLQSHLRAVGQSLAAVLRQAGHHDAQAS